MNTSNYTLRTVKNDNTTTDKLIGDEYTCLNRFESYGQFAEAFELCFNTPHVSDNDSEADRFTKECYAILVINGGEVLIPLYKGFRYYIMTESGKTFTNLTYK